jgi:uroporphyrinogen-III synthase
VKGKIIINTRPAESNDSIETALTQLGAEVISLPLVEVFPIAIPTETLEKIKESNHYSWLVFTSKNGVNSLLNQLNLPKETMKLPFKTAVFGERTAKELRFHGFVPDLVNAQNTSEDLINDLKATLKPSDKVLLVLGNLATNLIEESIKSIVEVERTDAYETKNVESVQIEILERIAREEYDLILFTSPSGFNSFKHFAAPKFDLSRLKTACIGPTTERTLLDEGITPLVVANPSGKEALIKGILDYFLKSVTFKTQS